MTSKIVTVPHSTSSPHRTSRPKHVDDKPIVPCEVPAQVLVSTESSSVPALAPAPAPVSAPAPAPSCKKRRNTGQQVVLKKAPQAPRRFKSSYILFFMAKQSEIKQALPEGASVGDVSKRSSQLWKALSAEERAYWNERAEQDKQRYIKEKDEYTGPWQVPNKRAKKNPLAPKRPMSSFLFFSKERRKAIKEMHPNMKNTEISSILGQQWRNATEEERRPHIEMEQQERIKYKVAMEKFNREEAERKKREAEALAEAKRMAPTKKIKTSPSLLSSSLSPIPLHVKTEAANSNAPSNYPPMGGQMAQQTYHQEIEQQSYRPFPYTASPVQVGINTNSNNSSSSSSSSSSSNITVANAMQFQLQIQQQNYQSRFYMNMHQSNCNISTPMATHGHPHHQRHYHDHQDQPSPINVNARHPSPSIGLLEHPFSFENDQDPFNTDLDL